MNQKPNREPDPDMLEEYDFSNGVRGKYTERFAKGANVVILDPDVAEVFPDSESVNQALRALAVIIRKKVAESGDEIKATSNKRLERTRR
jgi:hypothetical protein